MHKALQHCTNYQAISEKYPLLTNMAMDYVVNATLFEIDPNFQFIEKTVEPEPLFDTKYQGWSFIEVLQDLLKNTKVIQVNGKEVTEGQGGQPLDEHTFGKLA